MPCASRGGARKHRDVTPTPPTEHSSPSLMLIRLTRAAPMSRFREEALCHACNRAAASNTAHALRNGPNKEEKKMANAGSLSRHAGRRLRRRRRASRPARGCRRRARARGGRSPFWCALLALLLFLRCCWRVLRPPPPPLHDHPAAAFFCILCHLRAPVGSLCWLCECCGAGEAEKRRREETRDGNDGDDRMVC